MSGGIRLTRPTASTSADDAIGPRGRTEDVQTPFGLHDGRLVSPVQVVRGLACECTCPGCGAVLVARKGRWRMVVAVSEVSGCRPVRRQAILVRRPKEPQQLLTVAPSKSYFRDFDLAGRRFRSVTVVAG